MPNLLWLWVVRAFLLTGNFSFKGFEVGCSQTTKAVRWNLSSQPFKVVGGGLFIATWQPDLICPKWPWVTKELTHVPTVGFRTHTATFTWATSKADLFDSGQDFLSKSSLEDIGFEFGITSVILTGSLRPHLTVRWFLWHNMNEIKLRRI